VAESDRKGTDVVTRLGQFAGLVAGVLGLVYAAGGGVLTLRLYLAHLPSRTIVSQLPRELLISVGMAQIVFPIVAVAGLYATCRVLGGASVRPKRLVRQWKEQSRQGWAELVGAAAVPALVVAATTGVGAKNIRGGSNALAWLVPLTFLVTLLIVLVGLKARARLADSYGESATTWNAPRPVAWMTLVVALVALPVCVLVAGTHFPLLDAKVCTTSGTEEAGVLVGETSDRTYIGQKARPVGPLLVFSIPRSEIRETFIGGHAGGRPCPPRAATLG
jgi:hypothetical protein